ncbi:MAG: hypothetical protein JSW59_00140 [Phycisphaerales bacterium]|nr:MAG: hypothetical protein JSW59_00140 [Phycisphaerales bacterium]
MIVPRAVRKILAIFRGSVSPLMIFISVMLGFWFGLVPDFAGIHVAGLVLVFLLSVHLGLFLLSAGLGKALCYAAAPVLYHTGMVVQDNLSGLLNALASVPIIGLTDFSRYSVAGALVLGPIIGAVAGLLMARSVIGFRRALLKFEEGSEKFKKWYSNRWVRILDRLLVGKRTKDAKALFSAKTGIIRKAGVAIAVLILAGSAVAMHLVKDNMVKDYAARTLTKTNGAEVNLESLDLSVLGGKVSVAGIQVTDANKPDNNQVAIDKITADASIYDLLLGRLVMENVEISNVRFDQKRATPGEVIAVDVAEPEPFDPCNFTVTSEDIAKLEKYFEDAKAIKEKLKKARKWLPKSEEDAEAAEDVAPHKYLDYLLARAPIEASPRVMVRRTVVEKVVIPSNLFGNSDVQIQNVSDAPRTAKLPVALAITSHGTGAFMKVMFDYSTGKSVPEVTGDFKNLDLSKLQASLSTDAGLMFESGTASGKFNGMVNDRSIDLTINLAVTNMKARAQGDDYLGLDPKIASEALSVLTNLSTTIRIVGPITEPRLVFDVKGLQDNFKNAAIETGKKRLRDEVDKAIDEQIEKNLGDKAPDEIKDVLKKSKGVLDGLLGPKKKDE